MKRIIILLISFLTLSFCTTSRSLSQSNLIDFHFHHTRNKLNKNLKYTDKNPFLAGVASLIVPGLALGQIYNERYDKCLIHMGISAAIISLTILMANNNSGVIDFQGSRSDGSGMMILLSGVAIYLGNWIFSVVDSILTAVKINENHSYMNKALSQADRLNWGLAFNEQKKLQVKLKLNL